jgi:hypothetical protein
MRSGKLLILKKLLKKANEEIKAVKKRGRV